LAAAIISAGAALAGVCIAQLIGLLQSRQAEQRKRREEVANVVALTLSLIFEATHQIEQGKASATPWAQQKAWVQLREETWPLLRTALLTQATQQASESEPTFYELAQHLQHLLVTDELTAEAANSAWNDALTSVHRLGDRMLR
jgi:hypothetical protein